MKLTTFLVAFAGLNLATGTPVSMAPMLTGLVVRPTGSVPNPTGLAVRQSPVPRPTSPTPNPRSITPNPTGVPGLAEHSTKTLLFWDPVATYAKMPKRRLRWEKVCDRALAEEGCQVGVIHRGQTAVPQADGSTVYYINVEGSKSMDLEDMVNSKELRVYENGSIDRGGWDERDRLLIAQAKRFKGPPRGRKGVDIVPEAPAHEHDQDDFKPSISWNPPDAYPRLTRMKEAYEKACRIALRREGCDWGIIHSRRYREDKPDGTSVFHMDVLAGKHAADPEDAKYMRLFENGLSEWHEPGYRPGKRKKSDKIGKKRKRPIGKSKNKESASSQALPSQGRSRNDSEHPIATSTGPQAPIHDSSKPRITWHPFDAYTDHRREWRRLYHDACLKALTRTGYDFGIIRKGRFRGRDKSDGSRTAFVNVEVGRNGHPEDTSFMRLLEDGSFEWYPRKFRPTVSKKEENKENTSTQAPIQQHVQDRHGGLVEADTSAGAAHPGDFHAPDCQYPETFHMSLGAEHLYPEAYPEPSHTSGGGESNHLWAYLD